MRDELIIHDSVFPFSDEVEVRLIRRIDGYKFGQVRSVPEHLLYRVLPGLVEEMTQALDEMEESHDTR